MRREEMDLGPDMTDEELIAADIDIHEKLEESRRLAAELPVLEVIKSLEAGRTPSPALTVAQVKRQLRASFGRDVTIVTNGKIRSREEDR